MNQRTAVIYDPDPLWQDAIERVLVSLEISVIEKAAQREDALESVTASCPDLLVAELQDETGWFAVTFLREARLRAPALKTVVVSERDEPEPISAAFAAGASAYVLKGADPDDLAAAIRQTFNQSIFLASGQQVFSFGDTVEQSGAHSDLTPREIEILQLVAEGHSNASVAQRLWVAEKTVKFHLSNIYRKLGVANRTEASRWAHARGLVGPSDPAPMLRVTS